MQRMWINQPSTKQTLHHMHGVEVLAVLEYDDVYQIYFLSGKLVSMQAKRSQLSLGWKE
jgi:hypothetical protein